MKNKKKYLIIFSILSFLIINFLNYDNISTEKLNYTSAKDDKVSTRELAMLASLVYEDVPNANKYEKNTGKACIGSDNRLKPDCFFSRNIDSSGNDKLIKVRNSNYSAYQYIEGMSARKANSPLSRVLTNFQEDGQKYYFLNFADVSELEGSWSIFDYKTTHDFSKNNDYLLFNNDFDAITFKKGENYVIAYRGTDFPDLREWVFSDIAYAISGENGQAKLAYNYAQEQYDKIVKENPKAKIYVTGHSLGAYLAQIGGAAIVDKEANLGNPETRSAKQYKDLNDYKLAYYKLDSRLEQVAYFNGMGVTAMFLSQNFNSNIDNALVYLSTHDKNGELANTGNYVNYSNKVSSSGRLVLYSIDNDPVSAIGMHYGDIYKLDYAADAVTNHLGKHGIGLDILSAVDLDSQKLFFGELKDNLVTYIKSQNLDKNVVKDIFNILDYLVEKLTYTAEHALNITDAKPVPDFVRKTITDENPTLQGEIGNAFFEYSSLNDLQSIVRLLQAVLAEKRFNITEAANINHETDSFACIIDNAYGTIKPENIDLSVEAVNGVVDANNVYSFSSEYSVDQNYKLGDAINDKNHTYLKLKAKIKGGCVYNNGYKWYYRLDENSDWIEIKNSDDSFGTFRNEIIVPKSILDIGEFDTKNVQFKVMVSYGNQFRIARLKATNKIANIYEYDDRDSNYGYAYVDPISEYGEIQDFNGTSEKIIDVKAIRLNDNYKVNLTSNSVFCELSDSEYLKNSYSCYSNKGFNNVKDLKFSIVGIDNPRDYKVKTDFDDINHNFVNGSYTINLGKVNVAENDPNGTKLVLSTIKADTGKVVSVADITLYYDTEAPTCYFEHKWVDAKIKAKSAFSSVRFEDPVNYTNTLICSDNISGMGKELTPKFTFDADGSLFNLKSKKPTYEEINLTNNKRVMNQEYTIHFTSEKPYNGNAYYSSGITDRAGNSVKKKSAQFEINVES